MMKSSRCPLFFRVSRLMVAGRLSYPKNANLCKTGFHQDVNLVLLFPAQLGVISLKRSSDLMVEDMLTGYFPDWSLGI